MIRKSLPRLSDAMLRDLYAFLPRLIHRQDTVDVGVVRERLEFVVGRVLGPGVADAVLIQSMTDASPGGPQPSQSSQPARP